MQESLPNEKAGRRFALNSNILVPVPASSQATSTPLSASVRASAASISSAVRNGRSACMTISRASAGARSARIRSQAASSAWLSACNGASPAAGVASREDSGQRRTLPPETRVSASGASEMRVIEATAGCDDSTPTTSPAIASTSARRCAVDNASASRVFAVSSCFNGSTTCSGDVTAAPGRSLPAPVCSRAPA